MTVRRGGAEAHPRVLCGNADLSFELVKVCSLLPSQLCFRFFFFLRGGGGSTKGGLTSPHFPPPPPLWKHDLIFALTGAAWNQPFPIPLAGSLVSQYLSHTLSWQSPMPREQVV